MLHSKTIQFQNFVWINIENPDSDVMEKIGKQYGFHPLDIKECLNSPKRSKIDAYDDYGFLIMNFPVYRRPSRQIVRGAVKFFLSKKYLIIIHEKSFKIIDDLWRLFELTPDLRKKFSDESPERLLYEILNRMFLYCFPMIDHLIEDTDNIDEAIFSHKEDKIISEILVIRRNITDFRKITQVYKNVLKKLIAYLQESPLYVMKKTDAYFESLVDFSKEIWDTLENLKERIEALQDSNESQISFHLSHIMKTLTIISVFTFPLSLIAAIFSMNLPGTPFQNTPNGFWIAFGVIFAAFLFMAAVFRKNKWF